MFSSDKIPQPFINLIGTLYRFIAGAFGQDLPRPMQVNLCPYFWAVFFTIFPIPIGLPFVLLGWTLRLTFGKGRGGAIMQGIGEGATYPVASPINRRFTAAVSIVALGLVAWILWEAGWLLAVMMVVGFWIGIMVALIAIFLILVVGGDVLFKAYSTQFTFLGKMAWTLLWPVRTPIRFVFYFFFAIALAVKWGIITPARRGYGAACPYVEFQ